MLVNQATMEAIYKSFKTLFNDAFAVAKPQYPGIATVVPSSTKSEEYKWLGKIPRMREWVGDRIIKNLVAHGWTIKNKDWESTVAVDRNDIEDDTIGVYNPLIKALGEAAATHPDEIVMPLLHAGFASLCFDGQYFFDDDHPGYGGDQSNVGTAVLASTSYAAARAVMMAYTDEKGISLNILPNLLVVPPQLEAKAREILNADIISGTTNVWKGSADPLVVPSLAAYPTEWFLFDTKKPVKALIFQQRKKPNFASLDKETDENVFMRKEHIYGVDCRDNAGYGLWQLAWGSNGTV